MAVIFAVVGAGAATFGIANYDNHSDHSDYGNYNNYSDAAERKRMRVASLTQEVQSASAQLEEYKQNTVNPKLSSNTLVWQSAMTVSESEMDRDVKSGINRRMEAEIEQEAGYLAQQIKEIDKLLERIDEIQKEEGEK